MLDVKNVKKISCARMWNGRRGRLIIELLRPNLKRKVGTVLNAPDTQPGQYVGMASLETHSNMGLTGIRVNSALIFTVTETS